MTGNAIHIRLAIIFILSISLALISPPFIFARMDFASTELRAMLGLITIIVLVFSSKKLSLFDVGAFISVVSLFCMEIYWQRSELNNIASYYAVVVVYVLLFRQLRNNYGGAEVFLSLWVHLAYLLSIFAILTFVIHQFTSINTDLLNFSSQANLTGTDYEYSIFGLAQYKSFGIVNLARIDGYFDEPQYAGMYFAINILIARQLGEFRCCKYFFATSLVAGLLTFSTAFYITLVVVSILRLKFNEFKVLIFSVLSLFFVLIMANILFENIEVANMSFFLKTSLADRILRINNSVGILNEASSFNLWFGHGVGYRGGFSRGISSGLLHVWVERGLVGLFFVLTMLVVFSNKNRVFLLACLLFLLVLTWYKMYVYWIGIIVFWFAAIRVDDSAIKLVQCEPGQLHATNDIES